MVPWVNYLSKCLIIIRFSPSQQHTSTKASFSDFMLIMLGRQRNKAPWLLNLLLIAVHEKNDSPQFESKPTTGKVNVLILPVDELLSVLFVFHNCIGGCLFDGAVLRRGCFCVFFLGRKGFAFLRKPSNLVNIRRRKFIEAFRIFCIPRLGIPTTLGNFINFDQNSWMPFLRTPTTMIWPFTCAKK